MVLNPVTTEFLDRLAAALPPDRLRPPEPRYLEEPRGLFTGRAGAVALPASTDEVATIVRHAAEARVAIVPYGGGTGLVGGQVKPEGPEPLVLSLERMNRIRDLWPEEYVLVAEAGAVLADVRAAAERVDRLFPLSLASEGSARIGGLLSTNAGGVNVLRYGTARALCLGLEAVLPDGSVWHGLGRLRKDNTGYDLRDLLIGAEGTLGVITAASLALSPQPANRATAFLAVEGPEAALRLLAVARRIAAELVSAFELIHGQGLEFLAEVGPKVRQPLQPIPEWSVLIEIGGPEAFDPDAAIEAIYEAGLEGGLAGEGVVARSEADRRALWEVRESIPLANRRVGAIVSNDIALPLGEVADFVARAGHEIRRLGPFRINCFGHLGDGNLHYNIFPPRGETRAAFAAVAAEIRETVHRLVEAHGGSISAEHGIGRLKAAALERHADPARLTAMRRIKAALDPAGIMNPGAVLR